MLLLLMLSIAFALFQPSAWMHNLRAQLAQRTLSDVSLPGTHDSASFAVTEHVCCVAADERELIRAIELVAEALRVPVASLTRAWAQTQQLTIYEQAYTSGARYFDLRVCAFNGTLHGHHSFVVGERLDRLLAQLSAFLRATRGELLVVELSHADLYGANATLFAERLAATVAASIDASRIVRPSRVDLRRTVIGDIVGGQSRALFVYDGDGREATHDVFFASNSICNTYANSPHLRTMLGFNRRIIRSFLAELGPRFAFGQERAPLFKTSFTLTPSLATILESIDPHKPQSLCQLATKANSEFISFYTALYRKISSATNQKRPLLSNFLIADFVHDARFLLATLNASHINIQ